VQAPAKICEGLLPASRFCACAGAEHTAKQPVRSVTAAKMSARPNIRTSPDAEIASNGQKPGAGGDHLLADYRANGSRLVVRLRERNIRFVHKAVALAERHHYYAGDAPGNQAVLSA
jgi:hypothetical protein